MLLYKRENVCRLGGYDNAMKVEMFIENFNLLTDDDHLLSLRYCSYVK